jgi:Zinc knuckle
MSSSNILIPSVEATAGPSTSTTTRGSPSTGPNTRRNPTRAQKGKGNATVPPPDNPDYSDPETIQRQFQALQYQMLEDQQRHREELRELQTSIAQILAIQTANVSVAPDPQPYQAHFRHQADATPQRIQSPPARPETVGTPDSILIHPRKTQLTEKITPLDDGVSPTFRQWRISVLDRLEVNADYYPTPRSRLALVWGTTSGKAREYLEPRYLSDIQPFHEATDMIDLLATYYVTGVEAEQARNDFHDMAMNHGKGNVGETFADFQARFLSKAIRGNVAESEWFFYLWQKLTPQLRAMTTSWKSQWHGNYQVMVTHLLSIDTERRRNQELLVGTGQVTSPARRMPTPFVPNPGKPLSTPRPPSGHLSTQPRATPRFTAFDRPAAPKPEGTRIATAKDVCYNCGKPGHFKPQCPEPSTIKEIDADDQNLIDLEEKGPDYEDIRQTNDEA